MDRLIEQYPQAVRLDEAQFRRGEALFVEKRYAEAEQAYAAVLDAGADSAFFEQALYKHGWTLFKQQQHDAALRSFFALLDRKFEYAAGGDPDPAVQYTAMGRAEQELVQDTFRVVSISFSYLDGPAAISDYFTANGSRPYSFIVYSNLGDLYLEQERFRVRPTRIARSSSSIPITPKRR